MPSLHEVSTASLLSTYGKSKSSQNIGSVDLAPFPLLIPDPQVAANSALAAFTAFCRARLGLKLIDHAALHFFSVEQVGTFWKLFVEWSRPLHEGSIDIACTSDAPALARFFPDMRLSYAENLLAAGDDDRPAVIACHAGARPDIFSRGELRARVLHVAGGLRALGLRPGDRVAAIAGNTWQPVVACLAAAVGATFSSAMPEMGADAVLDRFRQVEPILLFCEGGNDPVRRERLAAIAAGLPGLRAIVMLDDSDPVVSGPPTHSLSDLATSRPEVGWHRFPFDHPLLVLFSSGTTGRPKCIVHGAGGTLLEHLKEHRLHGDLGPTDRMFFQTSCAWMMWNWQLSALATGATIVLYDGPVTGPETLWEIVASQRVTRFGTSPAFLRLCQDRGYAPGEAHDLSALRSILSTGSILHDSQFDWVMQAVGPVPLQSVSGGTDIVGCFVLGNPTLPVRRGEAQCRSLGMDVQAVDEQGRPVLGAVGELVCRTPFPSRPLGFLGDPDGARFRATYFARNPGMWTHGDLISFTPHGTARLHGRSDGMINVRGIRIGPAEFDAALHDLAELRACLAVEQEDPDDPSQTRLILLVVLQPGATLGAALQRRIREALARRASPVHVPAVIAAVSDLPTTHSGKRSERAAHDALNGRPINNRAALRNPDVLDEIAHHPALRGGDMPGDRPAPAADAPLQARVTAIWEDVLGIRPIGPDENFFDLGGHSLLAMQIADGITALLDWSLPVTSLLAAPTIAALTRLLERGAPQAGHFVRVRDGAFPPLFVVPSVSGTVIELHGVLSLLTTDRAIYGLQARGVDGTEPPQDRVEAMATEYLDRLRTVQPYGPYTLLGYSLGGMVAFEMARRLEMEGEGVALLAMLDSDVPPRNLTALGWLRFGAGRALLIAAGVRTNGVDELRAQARLAMGSLARRVYAAVGRPYLEPTIGTHLLPMALQHVRAASELAFSRYRVPTFSGRAVFFRADQRDPRRCDPVGVWSARAPRMAVVQVPGDHTNMLAGANAVALARALQGQLDALEAAAG